MLRSILRNADALCDALASRGEDLGGQARGRLQLIAHYGSAELDRAITGGRSRAPP